MYLRYEHETPGLAKATAATDPEEADANGTSQPARVPGSPVRQTGSRAASTAAPFSGPASSPAQLQLTGKQARNTAGEHGGC